MAGRSARRLGNRHDFAARDCGRRASPGLRWALPVPQAGRFGAAGGRCRYGAPERSCFGSHRDRPSGRRLGSGRAHASVDLPRFVRACSTCWPPLSAMREPNGTPPNTRPRIGYPLLVGPVGADEAAERFGGVRHDRRADGKQRSAWLAERLDLTGCFTTQPAMRNGGERDEMVRANGCESAALALPPDGWYMTAARSRGPAAEGGRCVWFPGQVGARLDSQRA